jgi:hypothetical protein
VQLEQQIFGGAEPIGSLADVCDPRLGNTEVGPESRLLLGDLVELAVERVGVDTALAEEAEDHVALRGDPGERPL